MTNPTDGRSPSDKEWPGAARTHTSSDEPLDAAKEKASELEHEAKNRSETIGQQAQDTAEDVKRQARDAAARTRAEVHSMAVRQKQAAAGQVSGFAQALKSASVDLDGRGQQFAARYVEQAADGLERVSDALERRDPDDLLTGVEDFARRQPIAFMGGAVIAGFGLARLMKSSAARRRGVGPEMRTHAPGAAPASPSPSGFETTSAGSASRYGVGPGTPGTTPSFEPGRGTTGEEK